MRVFALVTGLAVAAALGMAQKADNPGSQSGKNTTSSAQTQTKASTSSDKNNSDSASAVKTQTYKGTLVDASCSGGSATSPASSRNQANADRSSSSDKSANKTAEGAKGEASRGGDSANSCTPSTSTNDFALRTKDGHTLRFDAVGNERAKLAMTSNKKWKDASSASKTIQTSVSGTESGDKLTVLSIR